MAKTLKLFLALVLLATFLGHSPLWAAEKIKVATPTVTEPGHLLPPLAAQEKGFWSEQGLDAEWIGLPSTVPLMAAFSTGEVIISLTSASGVMSWIYRGIPLLMVAQTGFVPPWQLWVSNQSPIKKPSDLKGKKIGVSRLGSVTHAYALAFARAAGLEKDIRIVATGGIRTTIAGLKAGLIDVAPLLSLTMIPLEMKGEVRMLAPLADYVPYTDVHSIFSTKEQVAKRPEMINKLVIGLVKGMNFTMAAPDWAVHTIKAYLGLSEPAAKRVYELVRYSKDGRISIASLENMKKFLLQYGLVSATKEISVEEMFSRKFVPVE